MRTSSSAADESADALQPGCHTSATIRAALKHRGHDAPAALDSQGEPSSPRDPRRSPWPIIAVLLAVALLYSQSLDSPFHFDDDHYILRSEPIRNLSNWLSWPWKQYQYRILYELSLGLNMRLDGLNPWGYHAFNVAGHLLAVLAVYLLTTRLVRGTRYAEQAPHLPEAAALLFGLHPLASQPVLYVMARNNGWAAMLMLWATVLALCGHDALASQPRLRLPRAALWFLGAVILWIASMLFKQTTAVWPFLLALLWVFRHGMPQRRTAWRILIAGVAACAAGILIGWRADILAQNNIRLDFLATQFVIWLNIWRRVFLPFGMNTEHDFPVYDSFRHWQVLGAMAISVALIALAVFWLRRRRLAGLGVLWAYVTLLPTNSILFRSDYLSDRNVYLFVLGGVWVLIDAALYATQALSATGRKTVLRVACAVFVLLCVGLTSYQVYLYRDRTRLLEDAFRRSPHHLRVENNLGQEYEYAGRIAEAEQLYAKCVNDWESGSGRQVPQRDLWASTAENNLGKIAADKQPTSTQGDTAARPYFERALKMCPANQLALDNLAILLLEGSDYKTLFEVSSRQLASSRGSWTARFYRGCARAGIGQTAAAFKDLSPALDPVKSKLASLRARVAALQCLRSMGSRPGLEKLANDAAEQLRLMTRSMSRSKKP